MKVGPARKSSCPASLRRVQRCQQQVVGCYQCDSCFVVWSCPSRLHRDEVREVAERVPVQLLGVFIWCSPRKNLLLVGT